MTDHYSEAVAALDDEGQEIRALVHAVLAACQQCAEISDQLNEMR